MFTRRRIFTVGLTLFALMLVTFAAPQPSLTAPLLVPTCNQIGTTADTVVLASAPAGTVLDGGVFCRVLAQNRKFIGNPGQIGNADLLDREVIQAVDVFGQRKGYGVPQFNNRVFVCLQGSGSLYYLDATEAPRKPRLLAVTTQASYTCGVIPNAGTLVLTTR